MKEDFNIRILEQGWLRDLLPEQDLCSHGRIRLIIGGRVIAPVEGDNDPQPYGISESALALLRTLEFDHTPEKPVAEKLIFHGCGTMLMLGCPIGIDWRVEHQAGYVHISDVIRYDGTGEADAVRFPDLTVDIPEAKYGQQVVAFANQARQLFDGHTKTFYEEWEQQQYQEFWSEYNAILARYDV
jgi:hypothetical protein